MSKIKHLAFKCEYTGLAHTLVTPVIVGLPLPQENHKENKFISYNAIWDTGATHSVITQKIADDLGLKPVDMIPVSGVNSKGLRPVCLVNIILPNEIVLTNRRVTVCDLNSSEIDLLIGMDVITMGDFSISNLNKITHLTFAMPSFQNRTDLLDKTNAINNKKK